MQRFSFIFTLTVLAGVLGCGEVRPTYVEHVPPPTVPASRRMEFDLSTLLGRTTSYQEHRESIARQQAANTVSAETEAAQPPPPGKEKMELSGPLASGDELDWEKYRGKVTVVLNWASWCPHCRTALNEMERAIKAFEDKPFAVVGVNVDTDPEAGLTYIKARDVPFENIIDAKQQNAMQLKYPIRHVPFYYVVNKAGRMVDVEVQGVNLNAALEPLFQQAYDPNNPDPEPAYEEPKQTEPEATEEPGKVRLLGEPLAERIAHANYTEPMKLFGPTYDGKEFHWSDYRGRMVIVVFWASWCPGCKDFLPQLEPLSKFFRDRDLEIVTVNVDEDPDEARSYLKRIKLPFETIMDGEQDMQLSQEYPTTVVPTVAVVDKNGNITPLQLRDPDFVGEMKEKLNNSYYKGERPDIRNKEKPTTESVGTGSENGVSVRTETENEEGLVEAGPGSGMKGRGYGEDPLTYALKARWTTEQKLVFDVQIPKALSLFQAVQSRAPHSHEEFMAEIIEENSIQLPELPPGDEYVYSPSQGKLMIRPAK